MRRAAHAVLLGLVTLLGGSLCALPLTQAAPAFTLFESVQVRPLALAPDGAGQNAGIGQLAERSVYTSLNPLPALKKLPPKVNVTLLISSGR